MSKKGPLPPGDEAIKQAFGVSVRFAKEKGLSLEVAEAIFTREMKKSKARM